MHALQEVHRRTFTDDTTSNPFPASLAGVAFTHATTLLQVTKAKIALERRKFLKYAQMSEQWQDTSLNLARELTAEFRGLCAEEAYLQQELDKTLHDLRNKVKLEGELWDDLVSSSTHNSHLVSKATRLWESLLARKSQHEVLSSGPIEDLIAHREHRYRISGSSLLAAMDQSSQAPYSDELLGQPGNFPVVDADNNKENEGLHLTNETLTRLDGRTGGVYQTVDVAEVIRGWTHALQRISKQSLHLAKANDGEGPDILRSAQEGGSSSHAESLSATLAEHQQHLVSFQVLINQLKEIAPTLQKSISECSEKVIYIASNLPPMNKHHGQLTSPIQGQSSGRMDGSAGDVGQVTLRISNDRFDKVSVTPPTLKLPQLFSSTPTSSGKAGNVQRWHDTAPQASQTENLSDRIDLDSPSINQVESLAEGNDSFYVQDLKRSVREAALSSMCYNSKLSHDSHSDGSSEHFFATIPDTGFSHLDAETRVSSLMSKRLFVSQMDDSLLEESHTCDGHGEIKFDEFPNMLNGPESVSDYDHVDGFLSSSGSNATSDAQQSSLEFDDAQDQVFSPPLLIDTSLSVESFEDLLAPLSETETALMEH
ncbi:AUGMIN subunit 6-like isoform X2 [Lotus japonicus]|nr:AUGMIN subunit 6-like isoform X2 [Lotus japonicus]